MSGHMSLSKVAALFVTLGLPALADTCEYPEPDCLSIWQAHTLGYLDVVSSGNFGESITWTNNSTDWDVCLDEQTVYYSTDTQDVFTDIAVADQPVTLAPGDSMTAYYGSYTTANGVVETYLDEYGWWCIEHGFEVTLGAPFSYSGAYPSDALADYALAGFDTDSDGVDDLVDYEDITGVQAQFNIWDLQDDSTQLTVGKVAQSAAGQVLVTIISRNCGAGGGVGHGLRHRAGRLLGVQPLAHP